MPKRLVDGDALWRSDKLFKVEPTAFRAEYANLLPLALDDGTFECDARRIWAEVYAYNRPDVTLETVEQILQEFERVGLLVRRQNDKWWGYWTGIEKQGRLPPPSQRYKKGHPDLFEGEMSPRATLGQPLSGLVRFGMDRVRLGEEADPPAQPSSAKNLRIVFRQESSKKLTLGRNDCDWDGYAKACGTYGTEKVDKYFREWAREKKTDFKERDAYPLEWFLKDLDVMIEGDARREDDAGPTEEEMQVVQEEIATREQESKEATAKAKAEQDRLRHTHYPDDSFCQCEQCDPDFWKGRE